MAGEPNRAGPAHRTSAALPRPGGHYSHASVANGFVFVAGQLPITPAGEKLTDRPFSSQARQVLQNLEAALVAAGSGIGKLVHVRVYVDDIAHWKTFDEIYARWAGDAKPARAVVPTGPLHFGFKLEIEAVAVL